MNDKRSGRPKGRPDGYPSRTPAPRPAASFGPAPKPRAPRDYTPGAPYRVVEARQPTVPGNASAMVAAMLDIVEDSSPLPKGRAKAAERAVLELWRELTSERSSRSTDYIGEPSKLAAYLRYFLPWNVVRLIPILAGLHLALKDGDSMLDIGSGPLTLPIALWIARPELRAARLRVVCVDRVRRAMEAGQAVLEGLALRVGEPFAWKLELRKEGFQAYPGGGQAERHALVAAANVFNEGFWKRSGTLDERASELAEALSERVTPDGLTLVVEPGDPRSGAMIAALREAALGAGARIEAPCPHDKACPMPGVYMSAAYRRDDEGRSSGPAPVIGAKGRVKQPWCHFVLPSDAAPDRLERFSAQVGLPKDRLVASWLCYRAGAESAESSIASASAAGGPGSPSRDSGDHIRIVSDSFSLESGGRGRYACSPAGYTLASGAAARYPSGTELLLDRQVEASIRDHKSGAVVVEAFAPAEPSPLRAKTPGEERSPRQARKGQSPSPRGAGGRAPASGKSPEGARPAHGRREVGSGARGAPAGRRGPRPQSDSRRSGAGRPAAQKPKPPSGKPSSRRSP